VTLQLKLEATVLEEKKLLAEKSDAVRRYGEVKAYYADFDLHKRELEAKIAATQSQLEAIEAHNKVLNEHSSRLKAENEALSQKYNDDVRSKVELLNSRLKDKSEEVQKQSAIAEKLQSAAARDLAAHEKTKADLEELIEGRAKERQDADETRGQLKLAELERDRAVDHIERNKMVSVVSRFMIRKMKQRMDLAQAEQKRVEAGEAAMLVKIARAEQTRDAMDEELAQLKRVKSLDKDHYDQLQADASRMTVANREMGERLSRLEATVEEQRATIAQLRESDANLQAQVDLAKKRGELAKALSSLRREDLETLGRTSSEVVSAIRENLLPALTELPSLAAEPTVNR